MENIDVSNVKGVGDALREKLHVLGIETVLDLVMTFPSRYDHYEVLPLANVIHDQKATVAGEIVADGVVTFFGKKKSRLTVPVNIDGVIVKAIFFNRAFLKKQLIKGEQITLTGKWDQHRQQLTVEHHQLAIKEEDAPIEPVYLLRQVIPSKRFRKLVEQAFLQYETEITELLPGDYLTEYKLLSRSFAYKQMHFPEDFSHLKQAKRRLIYEELLLFQLKMQALRRYHRERTKGNQKQYDPLTLQMFINRLSFQLTKAQDKSLQEILSDLTAPHRMHRLLQGDVGSGKTVVASVALYATVLSKQQGALMVPTEILAEQHYQSLSELFDGVLRVELLTGSVKGKKRRELLQDLKAGTVDILIGTHALIQTDVDFKALGLVIIDEQHRFGVNQRKVLREKGMDPDVLFMTATPIPRTLAITVFGDMDVSVIDQMPVGRKPVETFWVKQNMLTRILTFIEKEVNKGHQAYVVTPLIEESDKMDIQNAVDLYQQLSVFYDGRLALDLMHGRLSNDEKDEVMRRFSKNESQVLVSTTVVEVGVNVPNATVMVIYDAERFGLSQLHQLRGRVGRSDVQSYCILIADPKGETGKERMRIMTETTDGFELAEYDLKLRGPGDFFGRKQSGLPEFKIANLVEDYRALETARKDAALIMHDDKLASDPEYQALNRYINDVLIKREQGFD